MNVSSNVLVSADAKAINLINEFNESTMLNYAHWKRLYFVSSGYM